jgi:hypothetical protein
MKRLALTRGMPRRCLPAVVVLAVFGSALSAATQAGFVPYAEHAYRLVNSVAFGPAGETMYFALLHREVREHRGADAGDVPEVALYSAHRVGDGWSEPELLPFAGQYKDYEPTLTPDGTFMVFNTQRPYPDGRIPETNDLWMVEADEDGWGEPVRIDAINSFDNEESYSSLMADRSLVYGRGRPGPDGEAVFDLYLSEYRHGYQAPTRHPVSSDRWSEGDPWIAPDGSYLIFTRWDDSIGWRDSVDLYIAFQDAASWSEPVSLDSLNTAGPDYGAAVSANGEWLYYRADGRFLRTPLAPVLEEYRSPPR